MSGDQAIGEMDGPRSKVSSDKTTLGSRSLRRRLAHVHFWGVGKRGARNEPLVPMSWTKAPGGHHRRPAAKEGRRLTVTLGGVAA